MHTQFTVSPFRPPQPDQLRRSARKTQHKRTRPVTPMQNCGSQAKHYDRSLEQCIQYNKRGVNNQKPSSHGGLLCRTQQ